MADSRISGWTPISSFTGNEYLAFDNGTNSQAQLSALMLYIRKSRWVDFYGADETGASNSLAGFLAMHAAVGYIECNPAGVYRLDDQLPFTNQNVSINGNGCTIKLNFATHNKDFIRASNAFTNQQTVTAIALVSQDFGSGSSQTTTQLTYGSAHGYAAGDWLRIGSNDLNAGSTPAAYEARGEFVRVFSAPTTTTLVLEETLKDTYTTNVRTWKMNTTNKLEIKNVKLDCVRGLATTANANMLMIEGYFAPVLTNVQVLYSYSGGVIFRSCLKQKVSMCDFNDLQTSSSLIRYGYGIGAYECEGGVYDLITGSRIRHLYTTGSSDYTKAETDGVPWMRGRTRNEILNGCNAESAENGAYSTHTDADGITFNSCVSDNPIGGPDGGSVGFAFRGRNIKMNACRSSGGQIGVTVFAENNDPDATNNFEITDFTYEANKNTTQAQVAISINGGFAGNQIKGVINNPKIIGGNAQSTNLLALKNCDVDMNGGKISANQATGGRIIEMGASATAAPAKLRWKGGVIDYTGAAGTGLRSIWLQDTSSIEWTDGEVITNGATGWNAIVDFKSAAGSARIENLKCDVAPSTTDGTSNDTSATVNVVSYKVNGGATAISGKFSQAFSTTGTKALALGNVGDPVIYYEMSASVTGVAINSVSAGNFIGQQLVLSTLRASAQTITVNDNVGGLLDLGANKTVTQSNALRIVWNGSVWTGVH